METKEKTPGILMMASYYKSISRLKDNDQLLMFKTIMEFGFNGIQPEFGEDKDYLYSIWDLIEPTLSKGIKNYNSKVANGAAGGKAKAAKAASSTLEPKLPTEPITPIEEPNVASTSITDLQKKMIKLVEARDFEEYETERFKKQIFNGDFKTMDELTEALDLIWVG